MEAQRSERLVSALDKRKPYEARGFVFHPPWEDPGRRWVVETPDGERLDYGGRDADGMMSDLDERYPEEAESPEEAGYPE